MFPEDESEGREQTAAYANLGKRIRTIARLCGTQSIRRGANVASLCPFVPLRDLAALILQYSGNEAIFDAQKFEYTLFPQLYLCLGPWCTTFNHSQAIYWKLFDALVGRHVLIHDHLFTHYEPQMLSIYDGCNRLNCYHTECHCDVPYNLDRIIQQANTIRRARKRRRMALL